MIAVARNRGVDVVSGLELGTPALNTSPEGTRLLAMMPEHVAEHLR